MTRRCERVQETLSEHGRAYLARDPDAREHVSTCAECRAFLVALEEVDAAFEALPRHQPPEEVVQKVIEAVRGIRVTEDDGSRE